MMLAPNLDRSRGWRHGKVETRNSKLEEKVESRKSKVKGQKVGIEDEIQTKEEDRGPSGAMSTASRRCA
jgi:hypothetical protein